MAGAIKFVFSGIQQGVQQLAQLKTAVARVASAAPSAGGLKAGGGLLARVGAAGGLGQVGQIGAALGSPLGALGAAAVGVGLALRSMLAGVAASTAAIKQEVQTRHEIAGKTRSATMSADERAVAAVVAKRADLIGGFRGTPELRKFFAERDKAEKFLFEDQVARALKVGAGDIQAERAFIKAPEAVVLTESLKTAQNQLTVQEEIRDRMTWIQKAYEGIANTMQGRAWNAEWFDAQRGVAAVQAP